MPPATLLDRLFLLPPACEFARYGNKTKETGRGMATRVVNKC